MNAERTLNQLAGHVRDEIAARRRTLALLEEQQAAIAANDPNATTEAVERIERELSTGTDRARRRAKLLGELSAAWGIPTDLLTLGSIAERGGAAAASLGSLREELRAVTAEVIRKNRLLAALIGMHRRVIADVIEHVLQDEGAASLKSAGTLIDAEA